MALQLSPHPAPDVRVRREGALRGSRAGGVAVEFALISLSLYLVLAGMLSLGRWMAVTQAAQDAARFAAREVALYPLPGDFGFADALAEPGFKGAVYDPDYVVVDLDATPPGAALEAFFANMPVVNQALRPLMITSAVDTPGGRRRLLHMPGAIVASNTSLTGLSVLVPRILERDPVTGEEISIELAPVLEEVAQSGQPGAFALSRGGIAAIRLNVPFQAAALTAFLQADGSDGRAIVANTNLGGPNVVVGPGPDGAGPYSGSLGLGQLEALGVSVRPFRRLVAAQALFRRELIL
ncbi:MAG: TadE/TadG family type IV pilus assembly protein [Planctomycetota bacterium]|nr:TadE/TadG family type IV pilus assembly protein [Planctomycetota bacterium]